MFNNDWMCQMLWKAYDTNDKKAMGFEDGYFYAKGLPAEPLERLFLLTDDDFVNPYTDKIIRIEMMMESRLEQLCKRIGDEFIGRGPKNYIREMIYGPDEWCHDYDTVGYVPEYWECSDSEREVFYND